MASRLNERIDDGFRRLDARELDHVEVRVQASELVRRIIGFDLGVWATIDPSTLMWTTCVLDGMPRDHELEAAVFRNEYEQQDVLKITELARTPGRASTLVGVTGGDVDRSRRHREVYGPRGFTDELRMVFADGDSAWGALCLLRTGGTFSDDEAGALGVAADRFGATLRRSLLRAAVGRPDSLEAPPGLIVCRADGKVSEISPEAEALLGEQRGALPAVVPAVLAKHAAGERAEAAVATEAGRWLAFHATRLGGNAVVVVEQVRPYRLAELIVRAHGLTSRERQVVECVAAGRATKQIARELGISEWTVQDHLKSVFAKFGVRSRQELVAAVFFDHYGPRHAAEDTPSPYGWYLDPVSPAQR